MKAALAAQFFTASISALADEAMLAGKSRSGLHVHLFLMGGEGASLEGHSLPSGVATAGGWELIRLQGAAKGKRTRGQLGLVGECIWARGADEKGYLSCIDDHASIMSGLLYEQRGRTRIGGIRFVCVRGCTRNVPAELEAMSASDGDTC